jgi:hypothetical protein
MPGPLWTEAQEQLLIRMWEEKAPAAEIAAALGSSYTRSAILGKVNRMRKHGVEFAVRKDPRQGRPKGSRNKKPPNYNPAPRSVVKLAPTPVTDTPIVESLFQGVSILEAGLSHCRAVIGHDDSVHGLAIYCGAPVVNKTSFCQGHFDRFYQDRIR